MGKIAFVFCQIETRRLGLGITPCPILDQIIYLCNIVLRWPWRMISSNFVYDGTTSSPTWWTPLSIWEMRKVSRMSLWVQLPNCRHFVDSLIHYFSVSQLVKDKPAKPTKWCYQRAALTLNHFLRWVLAHFISHMLKINVCFNLSRKILQNIPSSF